MSTYKKSYAIQRDQHEVVMELWKDGKSSTEVAEIINREWRNPQHLKPITHKTVLNSVYFARCRQDPRAIHHGNHHLRPVEPDHPNYRKPKDSLFRRKRRNDPVETKP